MKHCNYLLVVAFIANCVDSNIVVFKENPNCKTVDDEWNRVGCSANGNIAKCQSLKFEKEICHDINLNVYDQYKECKVASCGENQNINGHLPNCNNYTENPFNSSNMLSCIKELLEYDEIDNKKFKTFYNKNIEVNTLK